MNYEYRYLMEYLPKRYSATMKQENDREAIYDFKNGYCSLSLMNTIVECIKEIKNEIGGNNWRVCFIPASTHHKTACRCQSEQQNSWQPEKQIQQRTSSSTRSKSKEKTSS